MSVTHSDTVDSTPRPHRRLTEPQKRSIIASVATGMTQAQVAQQYGVHPNTVSNLCRTVAKLQNSPLDPSWRERLRTVLPAQSVAAIERSIRDEQDVHKAANTALAHLKGIGELASDAGTTNVFFQTLIADMPADMRQDYVVLDAQSVRDISAGDRDVEGSAPTGSAE